MNPASAASATRKNSECPPQLFISQLRQHNAAVMLTLRYLRLKTMIVVKNPPAGAGDVRNLGSNPGMGRSPGVGNGNPLQYSCLENPMDRGVWQTLSHTNPWQLLNFL